MVKELLQSEELTAWREAILQAHRSTLGTFKTGAVLFDRDGKVLSRGCSHITDGNRYTNSFHAEAHAISNLHDDDLVSCIVVTIGRAKNLAYSSRPCFECVRLMVRKPIIEVIWPERCNNGEWSINRVSPRDLYNASIAQGVQSSEFARNMRVYAAV